MAETYNLTARPTGIEHGLAYQALAEGSIDVTDVYSTDGELARYRLAVLDDDRGFFPRYLAVPFARADLPEQAKATLMRLAGSLDDARMQELNRMTTIDGRSFAEVASEFLRGEGFGNGKAEDRPGSSILSNTLTHLKLTAIALALGCLVGLPLGIIVFRNRPVANLTRLSGRPVADDPFHCAAGADDPGVRNRCKTGDNRPVPVFTPAHTAQYRHRAGDD